MSAYTNSEREQYNAYRDSACETLGISKTQYNRLRAIGMSYNAADEDYCYSKNYTEEQYNAAISSVFETRWKYITRTGLLSRLALYHQPDPHGCSLYADIKSITRDNYTGAVALY